MCKEASFVLTRENVYWCEMNDNHMSVEEIKITIEQLLDIVPPFKSVHYYVIDKLREEIKMYHKYGDYTVTEKLRLFNLVESFTTLLAVANNEYVKKEDALDCLEDMSNETVKVSHWDEAHRKDRYNQVALMDAKERIDALKPVSYHGKERETFCIFCGGNKVETVYLYGNAHSICADCKRENFSQ